MHKSGFVFSVEQFNALYPFFILADQNLNILAVGPSMEKLSPGLAGRFFYDCAEIKRPTLEKPTAGNFKNLVQQLLVWQIENENSKTQFRGQALWFEEKKEFLLVGSPWFNSVDELVESKLSFSDFAFHDPQIDLLHILKNQEINVSELKELLSKISKQKNELKAASRALQDMSLFPMQNPDPLVRIDGEGKILVQNPASEQLEIFTYQGKEFSQAEFWKWICPHINKETDRWMIEVLVEDKNYSFLCKFLPEAGYFNIYGRNITQEKASQEQINRLSLVASSNENGVLFTDPQGKITWANQGFETLSGYSQAEILNKTPLELLRGPLTEKEGLKEMIEAFENGRNFLVELASYKKNGTLFWSRTKGQAVIGPKGEATQYFALIEDITQEKEQEEQIRILSLIAEENQLGVIIADANGCITWVNKSFENVSGFRKEEVLGRKPGHFLQGPDTNSKTVEYLRNQIERGEPFVCDILNYHKSGRPYWLKIQGQALRNKKGEISGYFALEEDITKEKENQEALRISEKRWQFALEGAGDGVWEYDYASGKSYFSNQYKKMLGYGPEDDFGNDLGSFEKKVHPEDRYILKETERDYRNVFIQTHQREFRMAKKTGEYIWILDRGMVLERDEKGAPIKLIGTHSDITERKRAETALQFKEEKYRNILANMHLGILEVDVNHRIQYANQSFCQISGFELDELLGKDARSFLIAGENQEVLNQKNELRKKGKSDAYEIPIKNKRGEARWWLVSGAPNYNDKGELLGSIGIHLDITEQKNLQSELLEAREEALASSKSKEVFLANMSHEIRTPMHAISGMAEFLSKTELTERQRFYLEVIQSASENMLVILNDILDLSKLEASRVSLEKIGFDIRQVLEKAIRIMQHKAEEKGLFLKVINPDHGIASILLGDPFRLNQILFNLISNAIKFTEKGGITLECELAQQTKTHQTLSIKVSDTGIGMEKEFLEHIFEKFTQEHQSTSRKFGGTGLGMNITKELVDLMRGQISVKSEKGLGTVFSITIPFEIGKEADLPFAQKEIVNPENFKGLKVLLVDDNEMNRLVASTMLENLGAVCTELTNGKEAVDYMENHQADLILMDIQMPVMDGLEATKLIKKQAYHQTPIIALTANALKTDNDKYLKAGMAETLPKPFSEEALIGILSKVLGKKEIKEKPDAPSIEKSEKPLYNISNLEKIAQGNRDFIHKMLGLFLAQSPVMLHQIETALAENDLQTIASLAHKIKPSLDNLGIVSLREVVRKLEKCTEENLEMEEVKALVLEFSVTLQLVFVEIREAMEKG